VCVVVVCTSSQRTDSQSHCITCIIRIVTQGLTKREHEVMEADYEGFLQDLEEDKDLRATINIYRDEAAVPESTVGDDDDLKVGP
jgi:hypothetical protein